LLKKIVRASTRRTGKRRRKTAARSTRKAGVKLSPKQRAAKTALLMKKLAERAAARGGKGRKTAVVKPLDAASANNAAARAAANAAARQALANAVGRPITKGDRAKIKAAKKLAKALNRSPKQAAKDLQAFLVATNRHGSKVDRPKPVKHAQADMGVKADGIVGPATRKAARQLGVILPPRK